MKKHAGALLAALCISAAPSWGADPSGAAADDLRTQEEVARKATEEMKKELARNKALVDEAVKGVLREAKKNQEAMKEVFRELGRNKEELKKTIRDLMTDPELGQDLRELSDIIRETLGEKPR